MMTPLKVGASRRCFRKFWLNIHLYLALSAGFFFALLGVTGSLNVFYLELDALLNSAVHIEQGGKTYRPMDEIMASVRAEHPHRDGSWMMFMPRPGQPTLRAIYPKPEETADKYYGPLMVDVDPYTAEVISSRFWGDTLMTQIYELHASLLLGTLLGSAETGEIGFKIVGFLGVLLLISLATGIYLWWPRTARFRQAFTIKRGASAVRLNYDLHKTFGTYSAFVLLVLAFTGFSFAYRDWVTPVVEWLSPVNAEPFKNPPALKSTPLPGSKGITVGQAVAIADQVFPEAELRWLATPQGPDGYYAVEKRQEGELNMRRPRSKVWVDQYSGKVLKVEDPKNFSAGDTFLNLMFILHNGEALGLPGRILVCMAGLVPPLLYVTGLLHWLRKRRAYKATQSANKKGTMIMLKAVNHETR
jgi:uncharacterized iron-regulated membrane protein